jgi:hypothetical protein
VSREIFGWFRIFIIGEQLSTGQTVGGLREEPKTAKDKEDEGESESLMLQE